MAKFWWVNHKQTLRQEIKGGFLWSPKVERNGAQSHFYNNLRLAAPGDFVVSMAHGRVAHIGCVADYAISAPKPVEFGKTGNNWRDEGWLLAMVWSNVQQPFLPKACLAKVAPLLRDRYAPLQRATGHGNQKAYFSEIDEALFSVVADGTNFSKLSLSTLVERSKERTSDEFSDALEDSILAGLEMDSSLSLTERTELKKSRRGQGVFRHSLFGLHQMCRVTGIRNADLLIASHIKPWRSCETSFERLDGYNGLLLAPHVDFLFDRGLISFENSGEILLSPKLQKSDLEKFGITLETPRPYPEFHQNYNTYLEHHRHNVFLK
ncbi:HNH endonuclease [Achromobacter sp. NPDC058515]|uniref:HNH endonuclease n=1 Tax=Achromobacter sp. NPDC058515 TaxID=3346533 RepID=UPI0036689E60